VLKYQKFNISSTIKIKEIKEDLHSSAAAKAINCAKIFMLSKISFLFFLSLKNPNEGANACHGSYILRGEIRGDLEKPAKAF